MKTWHLLLIVTTLALVYLGMGFAWRSVPHDTIYVVLRIGFGVVALTSGIAQFLMNRYDGLTEYDVLNNDERRRLDVIIKARRQKVQLFFVCGVLVGIGMLTASWWQVLPTIAEQFTRVVCTLFVGHIIWMTFIYLQTIPELNDFKAKLATRQANADRAKALLKDLGKD